MFEQVLSFSVLMRYDVTSNDACRSSVTRKIRNRTSSLDPDRSSPDCSYSPSMDKSAPVLYVQDLLTSWPVFVVFRKQHVSVDGSVMRMYRFPGVCW